MKKFSYEARLAKSKWWLRTNFIKVLHDVLGYVKNPNLAGSNKNILIYDGRFFIWLKNWGTGANSNVIKRRCC